jgi:hypothetical protein
MVFNLNTVDANGTKYDEIRKELRKKDEKELDIIIDLLRKSKKLQAVQEYNQIKVQ